MWKQTRTCRPETEGTSELSVTTVCGWTLHVHLQAAETRKEGQRLGRLEKVYLPTWYRDLYCLSTLSVGAGLRGKAYACYTRGPDLSVALPQVNSFCSPGSDGKRNSC